MKCSFLSGRQTLFGRPRNRMLITRSFETLEYCKSTKPQFYPFPLQSLKQEIPDDRLRKGKGLHSAKLARKLAEAVLLQAVEDLWIPAHRRESIEFFTGEGFVICARLVGMGVYEKLRLIQLIKKGLTKNQTPPRQLLKQALA